MPPLLGPYVHFPLSTSTLFGKKPKDYGTLQLLALEGEFEVPLEMSSELLYQIIACISESQPKMALIKRRLSHTLGPSNSLVCFMHHVHHVFVARPYFCVTYLTCISHTLS